MYEVLLIGDSGNIKRNQPDELLEMMKNNLPEKHPSAVVFLGDNVYPVGLPDEKSSKRADAELVLNKHFDALKTYKGKVIFISGNHDWNKGKPDGYDYVIRQEKYLEKLFNDKNIYLPANGCPGPKEVNINKQVTIVAINTQWWLQTGYRPMGQSQGCGVETESDFFTKLDAILNKNMHKRVLVIGHYPIYSESVHGGKYALQHHLFPLTIYKKNAFLPLPLVGSMLPMYRKYFGAKEDISHPNFRKLRTQLKAIFKKYDNLIYACGHEHNLQYIKKHQNHFIVSGAASKSTYVLQGKYSKFGLAAKGFFKLKFYDDLSVKAEAVIVDEDNQRGELVYETWIYGHKGDNNL
ncbi:MAG: metallophosphoesterase [Sphingobacteriales bacterium]|nr:MAG: metallophosphoesterase [Sphingobacteriales bacterium]TAF81256.1 MAG: metallophosphoesterase [Sphingobacteriales bacterium]